MSSLVKYLQKHLDGEVLAGDKLLQTFATDASFCRQKPQAVVLARHEQDIRKTLIFLSQIASKGRAIPLTVRGGGSDLTGGAVGNGVLLLTPTYLNHLLVSNERRGLYKFEAGCSVATVQATLAAFDQFIPALHQLPATATLGGAVGNNASSAYSTKYGFMEEAVKSLKVVLANGETIQAERIARNRVLKKLTLDTFEGDIYRELDRLFFHDQSPYHYKQAPIFARQGNTSKILGGYNLERVCHPDGSLNLAPLFIGSQGTLGIVTEVEIEAKTYNASSQAAVLRSADLSALVTVVKEVMTLEPAVVSLISNTCLQVLNKEAPFLLKDDVDLKQFIVMVEFDDLNARQMHKKVKKVQSLAQSASVACEVVEAGADTLTRLRGGLNFLAHQDQRFYSGLRNAYVPLDSLVDFHQAATKLFKTYSADCLLFGDIGIGGVSVLVDLDLTPTNYNKKLLPFVEAYYDLVLKYGGRLSLERQEGFLPGILLSKSMVDEDYQLLKTIKSLFDPYSILNPHLKLTASRANATKWLTPTTNWAVDKQPLRLL